MLIYYTAHSRSIYDDDVVADNVHSKEKEGDNEVEGEL